MPEVDPSRPGEPAVPPPPRNPGWWSLHLWHIQPIRDALVIAAIFGVLYLGYKLSIVTVPILLAMLLAYLVEPLVKMVTPPRRGWFTRRGFALLLIFFTFGLIVIPAAAGVTYGVMQGATYAQKLSGNIQATVASVEAPEDPVLERKVENLGPAWRDLRKQLLKLKDEYERQRAIDRGDPLPAAAPGSVATEPDKVGATVYQYGKQIADYIQQNADMIGKQVLSTGGTAAAFIASLAGSIFSLGFTLFLTAFFFFFFCTGWGGVLNFWQGLIPEKKKHRTLELLGMMDAVIAGFIRGRLTICALMVIWFAIGYWLAGVPVPLLMALFAGVLMLAPYAQWLAVLVAIGLLWLGVGGPGGPLGAWQANWWWAIAGPLLVHGIGQLLDDYVLTPKIQGETTGMDTPTILFASLAGGILAGFYGLLLAIPVAACLKILLREIVWPQIKAWAEGRAKDPFPVAGDRRS
jgi:predicted PurR-regulated permease PerM